MKQNILQTKAPWLLRFDWASVVELNAALCAKTHSLHKPSSDGYSECEALWQSEFQKTASFLEVLEFLLACHRLSPFCFNNGNTFAAIARTAIMQLDLDTTAAVVRSAASHYVAGVLRLDELTATLAEVTIEIEP